MRFIAILICVMAIAGCAKGNTTNVADIQQAKVTAEFMAEAQRQVGMPNIVNFQERKLAKQIFELRDQEKLICYAYLVSLDGKLVFMGKCIGFGLPYSVQFTNPEKLVRSDMGSHYGETPMPQADPNGLFMPSGLSATWLMMIDNETGSARPVYVEPQIVVSPFKLH